MLALTLFYLFRRFLVVSAGVYALVRVIDFIWRWRGDVSESSKRKRLLYRYLEVQLWRTRLRRFWVDLLELAALGAALVWLISIHR